MNITTIAPTMTSLELVEFINSQRAADEPALRHDHFMAKVPHVLGEGCPKFRDTYTHHQNGQQYSMYRFPKREACLMAMSYSYELQAKVYDRMTALEAGALPALPRTFSEALRALADKTDLAEQQAAALALAAPKVAFVDSYVESTHGSMTITEVAKILGAKRNEFIEWMVSTDVLYRTQTGNPDVPGKLTPYARHIDAKRFEAHAGKGKNGHAVTVYRFTGRGVEWIAGLWAVHGLNVRAQVPA